MRVHTASRGYNDAQARYPRREVREGITVRRLSFSSFGKATYVARVAGAIGFSIQGFLSVLLSRSIRVVVFGTSPPFSGLLVGWAARIRRIPTLYWAADITPEQLFGLGKIDRNSLAGTLVSAVDRLIVRSASRVVVHDRFMADTIRERDPGATIDVVAPWPILDARDVSHRGAAFRARAGLGGARVVMYSGNHSRSNPLGTLLEAIHAVQDEVDLKYVFIGEGAEKGEVEKYAALNRHGQIISLPYQPLGDLNEVLAAGDVHVVSLGARMVGVIHPSKVYTALSVGRPILYLGPTPSHVSDLLDRGSLGWGVEHGNISGAAGLLREVASAEDGRLTRMGRTGQEVVRTELSRDRLLGRMCGIIAELMEGGRVSDVQDDAVNLRDSSSRSTSAADAKAASLRFLD